MASLLTYGMIGDRLSDLVADLRDFDEFSNPDIEAVIFTLNALRENCDRKVMVAGFGIEPSFAETLSMWNGTIRVVVPADKQTDGEPRIFKDKVRRVYGNAERGFEVSLDRTPWIVPITWVTILHDEVLA